MSTLKWAGLDIDPRKVDESTIVKPRILKKNLKEFNEGLTEIKGGRYLMPNIEAIHAGSTRNSTRYMENHLKGDPLSNSGTYSWLHPYPKPVIYNHDTNTEASGRVYSANFAKSTKAGRPGIVVNPRITEEKAIQSILDGRLMTVSIGATTNAAVCTICGTDIIEEGFCGHYKGESYDGHMCEWIVGELWFDELSWVNVPADSDAMVTDIGTVQDPSSISVSQEGAKGSGKKTQEGLVVVTSSVGDDITVTIQEGDSDLKTIEELKAEVETLQNANTELTNQIEQVTTEKSGLVAQLEEANQKVQDQDAEIQAKVTELEEKQQEVEAKTTEATQAVADKEAALAQVTELTTTVEGLKGERQALLDSNTDLSSAMHKATAERVVDLKVVLGKVGNTDEQRQEALVQHVARSTESLSDSLQDLLNEASKTTVRTAPDQVTNPGVGVLNDGKEQNVKNKGVVTEQLTTADVLANLLRGNTQARKS